MKLTPIDLRALADGMDRLAEAQDETLGTGQPVVSAAAYLVWRGELEEDAADVLLVEYDRDLGEFALTVESGTFSTEEG